jgi:hypothetical protein
MVTMNSKRLLWIVLTIVLAVAVIVVVTAAFTPQETNPAFAAAVAFLNAAGKGDDAAAFPILSAELQAYVSASCPDGSVSACIARYIPPEWGSFQSAVYRRATPDGAAWNVDLIGTYQRDLGASGVCVFHRLEQDERGAWRVTQWAGFLSCGDAASRSMATNPDTPNQAP